MLSQQEGAPALHQGRAVCTRSREPRRGTSWGATAGGGPAPGPSGSARGSWVPWSRLSPRGAAGRRSSLCLGEEHGTLGVTLVKSTRAACCASDRQGLPPAVAWGAARVLAVWNLRPCEGPSSAQSPHPTPRLCRGCPQPESRQPTSRYRKSRTGTTWAPGRQSAAQPAAENTGPGLEGARRPWEGPDK